MYRAGPDQNPLHHAEMLHEEGRGGRVTIAARVHNGDWHERSVALEDMLTTVCGLRGYRDTYMTYNRFWGRRRLVQNLRAIDACYVDIGFYTLPRDNAHKTASPEVVTDGLFSALDTAKIPRPSLVTFTGRGLALVWCLDPIPAKALPRWTACQRELCKTLKPFGADVMALDAARLTRIAGTVNSKSGQSVRILFEHSSEDTFDFDTLADQVLPFTRDELAELRAKRAAKSAAKPRRRRGVPHHRRDAGTLHQTVFDDLQKLLKNRFGKRVPSGQRNAFAFFMSCSLAWLVPAGMPLEREIIAVGDSVGWSPAETLSRMSAVINRAQSAAADGDDQRYRHKVSTIVERLTITEEEMRRLNLRCLISPEIRRERDAARKGEDRQQAGCMPRDAHLAAQQATRQRALDLSAAGFCAARIGDLLGKSKDAAQKLIQRARREGLIPKALAANKNETPRSRGVDTSVHVNGGEALPAARTATQRGKRSLQRPMNLMEGRYDVIGHPPKPRNQNSPHRGVQLDLFRELDMPSIHQ